MRKTVLTLTLAVMAIALVGGCSNDQSYDAEKKSEQKDASVQINTYNVFKDPQVTKAIEQSTDLQAQYQADVDRNALPGSAAATPTETGATGEATGETTGEETPATTDAPPTTEAPANTEAAATEESTAEPAPATEEPAAGETSAEGTGDAGGEAAPTE